MSEENPSFRGHRAARLERAVFDVLECDLLPSLEDPLLNDLHVLHIAVKNLACIEAVVAAENGHVRDADAVNTALAKAEAWMRRELAASLRIKRMPDLRVRFVPIRFGADAIEKGGSHE